MSTQEPPDPVELPDFKFKILRPVKLGDSTDDLPDSVGLLAFSSQGGYIFAGVKDTLHIIKSTDVEAQDECSKSERNTENTAVPSIKVQLPADIIHVGISCDCLIVSVVVQLPIFPMLYLFDTRGILEQDKPFAEVCLNTTLSGVTVSQVQWNPAINNILTVTFGDGSLALYTIKDDGTVDCLTLPPAIGIVSVSWSPKGKQLATVKRDGTITQYKPDLKEAKTYQIGMEPVSIFWISTYEFLVGCLDKENEDRPGLWLVKGSKEGAVQLSFYDDICYSMGESRAKRFDSLMLPEWNYVVVCSANSMELAMLAKNNDNWTVGILDDAGRAELPLPKSKKERYPAGMALNFTAQRPTKIGEENEEVFPLLHVLTSDGTLVSYSCVNTKAGAQELCPDTAQKPLTQEGRRKGVINYPVIEKPAAISCNQPGQSKPDGGQPKLGGGSQPVQFASGIFNPGAAFSQSTPMKPPEPIAGKPGGILSALGGSNTTGGIFGGASTTDKTAGGDGSSTLASGGFLSGLGGAKTGGFGGFGTQTGSTPASGGLSSLAGGFGGQTGGTLPNFGGTAATGATSGFSFSSKTTDAPSKTEDTKAPALFSGSTSTEPVESKLPAYPKDPSPPAVAITKEPTTERSTKQDDATNRKLKYQIDQEYTEFENKMADLRKSIQAFNIHIGTKEEKVDLVTRTDALKRFAKEVMDTTACQANEVKEIKLEVAETATWQEEAKARSKESGGSSYARIMRSRPLDPRCQRKMKEINSIYNYIELQLDEANNKLDIEWEEGKAQARQELAGLSAEQLFTALLNNHKIVEAQRKRVDRLLQDIEVLKRKKSTLKTRDEEQEKSRNQSTAEAEINALANALKTKSKISNKTVISTMSPVKVKTPIQSPQKLVKSPVKLLSAEKDSSLRKRLESRKIMVVKPVKHQSPARVLTSPPPPIASSANTTLSSKVMLNQVRQAEHSSKAAEEKAQQLKKSIETAAQQAKTASHQKTLQFDAITPVKEEAETKSGLPAFGSKTATSSSQQQLSNFGSTIQAIGNSTTATTTKSELTSGVLKNMLVSGSAFGGIGGSSAGSLSGSSSFSTSTPLTTSSSFSFATTGFGKPSSTTTTTTSSLAFSTTSTGLGSGFSFTTAKQPLSKEGSPAAVALSMKKEPTPPLSVSKESSVAVTKPVTTLASGTTEPEKPKSSITGLSSGSAAKSLFGSPSATGSLFGSTSSSLGKPVASVPSLAVTTTTTSLSAAVSSSSAATDSAKASLGKLSSPAATSTSTSTTSSTPSTQSSSIFGRASSGAIFGGVGKAVSSSGGIFGGGSSLTTTPSSGAGIFGGAASSISTTSASSGLFGGTSTTSTASVFGGSAAKTTPATSVFGGATTTTTAAGVFGGAATTTTSASVFSGDATTTTAAGVFGGAATTTTAAGVFGGAATTTTAAGVFGGATTTTTSAGVFGGSTSKTTAGVFGGSTPATTSASVFGGAAAAKPASSSVFGGSSTTTTSASVFGGNTTSTTSTSSAFGGGSSIFGGSASSGSVFGKTPTSSAAVSNAAAATSAASPFGSSAASPFGTTTTSSGSIFGGGATTGSIFGGSSSTATTTAASSPFGGSTPASGGSIFSSSATAAKSGSIFGGGSTSTASPFGGGGGAASPFGGGSSSTAAASPFGGSASTTATSPFGGAATATSPTSGGSIFGGASKPAESSGGGSIFGGGGGGGFLSGLGGGSTSAANANKNPFGGSTFGGTSTSSAGIFGGSSSSGSGLFGGSSSTASTFGGSSTASTFGSSATSAFSGGGGSTIGSSGFGVSSATSPPRTGGFGAAPAFGGAPAFGSPPAFGGAPAFGSAPVVANTGFGAAAASNDAPTFGSLSSATPTFGNLGGGGQSSFGAPSSGGFGGFGSSGGSTSPPPAGAQFTSWR